MICYYITASRKIQYFLLQRTDKSHSLPLGEGAPQGRMRELPMDQSVRAVRLCAEKTPSSVTKIGVCADFGDSFSQEKPMAPAL
jgi:hypothetical protein